MAHTLYHTLPTELWVKVIELLGYADVLSMAAVSRFFLHDVLPSVTSLTIQTHSQLHCAPCRRCPLVTTVSPRSLTVSSSSVLAPVFTSVNPTVSVSPTRRLLGGSLASVALKHTMPRCCCCAKGAHRLLAPRWSG